VRLITHNLNLILIYFLDLIEDGNFIDVCFNNFQNPRRGRRDIRSGSCEKSI
jgi:hypothetical protein